MEHQSPSVCLSIDACCVNTIVLAIHFVDHEFLSHDSKENQRLARVMIE